MYDHEKPDNTGDLDTLANANSVPKIEPKIVPKIVRKIVLPRPAITGSEKNHSLKIPQPHLGLVNTEYKTKAIRILANIAHIVRIGYRAGTIVYVS